MKNIYLLHTETPSRLFIDLKGKLMFNTDWTEIPIGRINQYIYITSDEKPKDGDWCFNPKTNKTTKVGHHGHYGYSSKKIILTIDPDLIKEGVQDIKNEFLEWFVKNPSCEWVEVEIKPMFPMYSTFIESIDNPPFYGNLERKIIIPQEEPKQENCCTPIGQIKRYVDCVGCDKKPKEPYFFYEELKKHFENTQKDKLLEEWEKSAESDKIGPTVEEFLNNSKQETLEEAAVEFVRQHDFSLLTNKNHLINRCFQYGAKWMEEKLYSDLTKLRNELYNQLPTGNIDAFQLIKIIKTHIQKLDELCEKK
jgi:hypothetical protein